jgi:hypothetical protein
MYHLYNFGVESHQAFTCHRHFLNTQTSGGNVSDLITISASSPDAFLIMAPAETVLRVSITNRVGLTVVFIYSLKVRFVVVKKAKAV